MQLKPDQRESLIQALSDAFTSWQGLEVLFSDGSLGEKLTQFSASNKGLSDVIEDILKWLESHDTLIRPFLLVALKKNLGANKLLLTFVTDSEQIAYWYLKKDGVETKLTGKKLSDSLLSAGLTHAALTDILSPRNGGLDHISCDWPGLLIEKMESQGRIEELITTAHNKKPDNSELQECLRQFLQPRVPVSASSIIASSPPAEQQVPPDPEADFGHDIHWDRTTVTNTFVKMIKQTWPSKSQRIISIQGPEEAGINSLVKRLEEICNNMTLMNLICIRFDLEPSRIEQRYISPINITKRLAESLAIKCRIKGLTYEDSILKSFKIDIENKEREIEKITPSSLEEDLVKKLKSLTQTCTVVILLQHFEILPETAENQWESSAEWLRHFVLMEAPFVEKLVVVITGTRGLSEMTKESWKDVVVPIDPLEKLKSEEWYEWAHDFGLEWIAREEVEQMYKDVHGNVEDFAKFIRMARYLKK